MLNHSKRISCLILTLFDIIYCMWLWDFCWVQDCGREIDQLCSFLGLSPSVEEKKRVTTEVKFDNMKQNKMISFTTVKYMDQKVSSFMRKGTVKNVYFDCCTKILIRLYHWLYWFNRLILSAGKVGDWKNHFTVAQNEQFDEDYKQKMKNPTLKFRTEV